LRIHSGAISLSFLVFVFAGARAQEFPVIGTKVPEYVMRQSGGTTHCQNGTAHSEPCTTVNIRGYRVTIAWDEETEAVTYLFTDDMRLIGDSELGVGGHCRIAGAGERGDNGLTKYREWLVTEEWKERFRKWSGDTTWYAALQVDSGNPEYAFIVGFVQSRDLKPSH